MSRRDRSPSSPDQEERRAAETVLGRVGSPADVADAILYLAGAEFVTGTTIVVDGGRLLQTGRQAVRSPSAWMRR